jgi:ABC-type sugar transport system substrate-binding protein
MSETFWSRLRARIRRIPAGSPRLGVLACGVLGAALVLGIAGCGSSGSSSSSSSSTSGSSSEGNEGGGFLSSAVEKKLDKEVAELEQRPTKIGPTEKITKPIPPGKTIDVIHCSVEACTAQVPNFEAAAEAVGWNVVPVEAGLTSESIKNAWEQVVNNKPDAVITFATPESAYAPELAELKAMHIPVVNEYASGEPGGSNGVIAPPIDGNEYFEVEGAALAKYVLVHATEPVKAVMFKVSLYPNNTLMGEGFKSELEKQCPECEMKFDNLPVTDVGTNNLPPQIVSYFQANPDTNWGYLAWTDLVTGVPAAMRGAGLTGKAQLVSLQAGGPAPAANSYLENGEELVALAHVPGADSTWQCIDELIRYFTGMPTADDAPTHVATWLVTQKVMEEEELGQYEGDYPMVADYQSQFEELWGVK